MQGFHFSIKPSVKRDRLKALIRPLLLLPLVVLFLFTTPTTPFHDAFSNLLSNTPLFDHQTSLHKDTQTSTTSSTSDAVHHETVVMQTSVASKTEWSLPKAGKPFLYAYVMIMGISMLAISMATALSLSGLVFFMLLFRDRYPTWFYHWNVQVTAWSLRIAAFALLATDTYPDVEKTGDVKLTLPNPAKENLSRFKVLVKWLLAIPHFIVLLFPWIFISIITPVMALYMAITGTCPTWWFNLIEGFLRYNTRVQAYVFLMLTDQYPPFAFNGNVDKK